MKCKIMNYWNNVSIVLARLIKFPISNYETILMFPDQEFNRSLTSSSNIGMNEADSSSSADSDTETDSSDENKSIPVKPVSRPQRITVDFI